jgi:hypothetical protein
MGNSTFFIIFATAVVVFAVDASISQVADFLIEQTTSFEGIALFLCFFAVLILISFILIRLMKYITSDIRTNSLKLRIVYGISIAAQLAMIGIYGLILSQIIIFSEYYTIFLISAALIGYSAGATVMVISTLTLVDWYRFNRNSYVALVFATAFAISAYTYSYLLIYGTYYLSEKNQVVTADSEVIYTSDTFHPNSSEAFFRDFYDYAATGGFLLLVVGSATLLHHYAAKIGRIKFWTLLLLPLVYYVSTLIDTLGLYVPESDTDFFNYYLYVSLNGVVGGLLLGFAFWRVSKALSPNKSVAGYLQLCSFGFVFQMISDVGGVSAASYPPFGFASFSILALSASMVIMGLYSTAVSISQDIRLRQSIRELTKTDSGFLSNIGNAQMEKKVQAKAFDLENVVKEQRMELEKKSGIQSSIEQQDIKQYLLEVLQEVDKHKSSGR